MAIDFTEMLTKPQPVVRAEEYLRDQLVGEVLPKQYKAVIGNFVLEQHLRAGTALEDLTYTLLRRHFKSTKVILEPYGKESFPDLLLGFSSTHNYTFEVKSKGEGNHMHEVDLASEKMLWQTTMEGDYRYYTTWYLIWTYQENTKNVTVTGLECQPLWRLAAPTESGRVKLSHGGKGRTKYVQKAPGDFATMGALADALVLTYEALGYPAADLKIFKERVSVLK